MKTKISIKIDIPEGKEFAGIKIENNTIIPLFKEDDFIPDCIDDRGDDYDDDWDDRDWDDRDAENDSDDD